MGCPERGDVIRHVLAPLLPGSQESGPPSALSVYRQVAEARARMNVLVESEALGVSTAAILSCALESISEAARQSDLGESGNQIGYLLSQAMTVDMVADIAGRLSRIDTEQAKHAASLFDAGIERSISIRDSAFRALTRFALTRPVPCLNNIYELTWSRYRLAVRALLREPGDYGEWCTRLRNVAIAGMSPLFHLRQLVSRV
jgi:hypothetical protein